MSRVSYVDGCHEPQCSAALLAAWAGGRLADRRLYFVTIDGDPVGGVGPGRRLARELKDRHLAHLAEAA